MKKSQQKKYNLKKSLAICIKTKEFQRKTEVFCIVFLRTCCYNTITVKQTGTQEGKRWQRLCVFNKQIKRKFKEGFYNKKKKSLSNFSDPVFIVIL